MRPTTRAMLQQNNNNNYPCLSMSASTQDIFQKCSRTALPFSSRLELGEFPLIRGLRAWALCSRTRRRAGALLGGGKAPVAPPLGRGSSTSCLRPADVYLSGELDPLGYRMPQGLDSRQAGIGALVTVATLKTSEGSGKTQTQCLFLRTEKGSCLYSKPGSGGTTGLVGDLLKGKRGGGGGGTDSLQAGPNRVRVRSGRRWRKSGNVAGREKTAEQQKSWEDPNGGFRAEEGQEEEDKGFCSPQQDCSRTRCCHDVSAKNCTQCGRRPQRKEIRDVTEGESPGGGVSDSEEKGMRRVRHRNEEEREVPDPESNTAHVETSSICDVDPEQGRAERTERQRRTPSPDFTGGETNLDVTRRHAAVSVVMVTHAKTEKPGEDARGGADPDESGSIRSTASLRSKESSSPLEGRVWDPDHARADEELDFSSFQAQEPNQSTAVKEEFTQNQESPTNRRNDSQQEEQGVLSPPLQQRPPSISETGRRKPEDECTCSKVHDGKADSFKEDRDEGAERSLETEESWNNRETTSRSSADPPSSVQPFNPAPSPPPPDFTETSLPGPETGEEKQEVLGAKGGDNQTDTRTQGEELEEQREEERSSIVATEEGRKEEEEDEFGVFMQAEGVPAWSEEVPYGSRGSTALGNQTITTNPDWTASPSHQHHTWTAFPQDAGSGGGAEAQWWLAGTAEARRGRPSTNHSLAAVFAEAFPSPPGVSSADPCDLDVFPTLTQLLRGRADQDQGLLDHFHDLNKMIGRSYKRVSSVSRELLLNTLRLQQPIMESRPAAWTSNRRLSPGLPSANQHAHHAAAKRRLSYDFNRNVVE